MSTKTLSKLALSVSVALGTCVFMAPALAAEESEESEESE